ncbi:MAG: TonB-dependent receptor [Sphingobium sp.]
MKKSLLLCGVAVACFPAIAQAQSGTHMADGVEGADLIVTAQRRAERLVDVPISVNAINAEELAAKQINSVFDLAKSVTSLRFEGQAPVFMPTLRGIGSLVLGGSLDASVPVYLDGVYLPNTRGMNFDLPNVEGIQVLKGPQGTLFGRNSTGGAILITTSAPSDTFTGRFKATYARFNDLRLQGYVSGPINENIAAGLSVSYRKSDGYTKNIITGSKDDAPAKMFDIRPDIRLTNNEGLSVRLIYEHSYAFDATALGLNTPDGNSLALSFGGIIATKPFETTSNYLPVNRNVGDSWLGIIDWELNDSITLKNSINYRNDRNDFDADADQSNLTIVHVGSTTYFKTFSEELTLNGKTGNLDWVVGAYYYNNKFREAPGRSIVFGVLNLGSPQHTSTETIAGFADATYEVTPGLFLTAGARYSTEKKSIIQYNGATGAIDVPLQQHRWNSFTPRAVIRYAIDPNSSVYASYSRGYKTGTYAGGPPTLIKPEHLDAYEIGFKHSSPKFSINAAAFYYNYRDFQVSAVDVLTNRTLAVNAEKERNIGAELEMTFHPTPAWQISLAGAYLDAKFIRFANGPHWITVPGGGWTTEPLSADGTRAPRSPKWSGNASTSYDIDVGSGVVQLMANVTANTVVYNVVHEQFPVHGYAEVGANISYTTADNHWRGELFVSNLTNNKRPQQLQGGPTGTYAIWAPPRIFGASLSYNF